MSIEIYQRIAQFGKKLAQFETIDTTLPSIAEEAKSIVSAERCSIFIVDQCLLCRPVSYIRSDAEIAAFNDSTCPCIGILI